MTEPYKSAAAVGAAIRDAARNAFASIDLGDFFRFVYTKHQSAVGGDQQTYTDGYGAALDVYIGADKKEPLHVDLVVGAIITDEVTVTAPANHLDLPRLPNNDYRLYPIVDQIADNPCSHPPTSSTAVRDGRASPA